MLSCEAKCSKVRNPTIFFGNMELLAKTTRISCFSPSLVLGSGREAVLCADKLRTDLPEGWVDVESLVRSWH